MREIVWKIGGEQGTGLDSTSDVFATVCNRLGYYIYAYKTFASRIKGGHTNFTVRVSTQRVLATAEGVHVLVAMDQDSIDRLATDLVPGGLVIADARFNPKVPEGVELVTIPMSDIARELLNPVYKNIVAIGASAALLGLPLEAFKDYLAEKFAAKGDQVVQGNWTALERGYNYAREQAQDKGFQIDAGDGEARFIMTGNDAIALGAAAAGCRLVIAYPITPASEVLEVSTKILPKFGGAAVQVEDELAAVGAIIGAGFAGARALTATSGPGIALMQENIGLASMTEIPCVIVDVQRGGPSTGMPTKHEQSDLLALTYGGHGEAPRIVLTPGTAEQAFYDTILAFNLADNYQCPVLIASDLGLGLWQQTVEGISLDNVVIDRGPMVTPDELENVGKGEFERYALTESGVSPRSIPGMKNGQYLATGVEHSKTGKVLEDPQNRVNMMQKRLNKIKKLELGGVPVPGVQYEGPESPDILLISYGSTFGVVAEAAERLREQGRSVATLQVRVIHPLPVEDLKKALGAAKATFVVENNATGQLAFLMRAEGIQEKVESVLKYDGTLFRPDEIAARVVESLEEVRS